MAVATAEEEQVKIAAILRKQEEPGGTWFRELLKHLVGRNPPTQIATSDEESARSWCEKRLRRVGRANRTIDYDIVRGGAFPIKPLDPSRKEQLVEPAHPPWPRNLLFTAHNCLPIPQRLSQLCGPLPHDKIGPSVAGR